MLTGVKVKSSLEEMQELLADAIDFYLAGENEYCLNALKAALVRAGQLYRQIKKEAKEGK